MARTTLSDPAAARLIERLDDELAAMYPEPGANHFTLTPSQVADGAGGFVVADLDDTPVGCGAYRMIEPGVAEIKRMFVDPAARGIKLGAAILDTLEAAAIGDGATRLVLETGTRQDAALGLVRALRLHPHAGMGRVPRVRRHVRLPGQTLLTSTIASPSR